MTDLVTMQRLDLDVASRQAALLTLDRPEALNALDRDMLQRLGERLDECAADPSIAVVLLTGAGRAFSAGGDLKKYIAMQKDPEAWIDFAEYTHRRMLAARANTKPVVALVNGIAIAGGIELIAACDFAYAAASARIGDGHLTYGMMGGGGALSLLPRLIGPARARELVFSGRTLDAAESLEWGIVSKVVPDDELLGAGLDFAQRVARMSPLAVANAKQVMNESEDLGLGVLAQCRYELERATRYYLTSHDAAEGLVAFSERRQPRFTGR